MESERKDLDSRVQEQISQYKNVENMHAALGNINAYWKKVYHTPRFREATGAQNHIDFYARQFKEAALESGICRILSLGSGDGAVEIQIAKKLESIGVLDYEFILVELSPHQNKRALRNAAQAKLNGSLKVIEADLNSFIPAGMFSSIMAHHSLHHVLELEFLFDGVLSALTDNGRFVTFDVIGRNGHLRWPETYKIINALWHFLPEEKRVHAILPGWDSWDYKDHDCSTQGFEGIRAQDILPELVVRFHFETFFAWGGVTDVFVGRSYGSNYSPDSVFDKKFIGLVDELNEVLIDLQVIKPTNLCASMTKRSMEKTRLYKGRRPLDMLRNPNSDRS